MMEACFGCNSSIGVIDSGVGGITVLSKLMSRLPHENFIYLADKSGAPYGDKSASHILLHMIENCRVMISRGVKAIVVACNTATNVGIASLRREEILPKCIYVGLEPAVKPAMEMVKEGNVLVLLTPATAKQKKFNDLIHRFDRERIIVSPQPQLATLIENNICSIESLKPYVFEILSGYKDVGAVVLGCTHYIYLKSLIEEFYEDKHNNCKYKARVFDGNDGVANRLDYLLTTNNLLSNDNGGCVEFIIT